MQRRFIHLDAVRMYRIALGVFIVVMLALIFRFYPGHPSYDVLVQYDQALSGRFTDRHPPMGVVLLVGLLWTGSAIGAMFVLQTLFYTCGIGLLSAAAAKTGRPIAASLVVLAGLSPLVIFYNTQIYADVTVYVLLILAIGGIAWFRLDGRSPTPIAYVGIAVTLLIGMMARANAVFAVGPLFIYLAAPKLLQRSVSSIALSLAIAAAGIALTSGFNRGIGAQSSGFDDALPFYDIIGIANYSGDVSSLPPSWNVSLDEARRCYSPHYWDPLTRKFCDEVFHHLPQPGSSERKAVKRVWLSEIVHHPLAYAEHRLKHFDAQLNWIEPSLQCRYAPFDDKCGNPDPKTGRSINDPTLARLIRQDYIKKNFLTWPVGSLALSVVIWILSTSIVDTRMKALVRAGILSAIIYAVMYLFVGIAANIRYFMWTMLASGVFGALLFSELVQQRYPVARLAAWTGGVLGVVWVIGLTARIGDWSWFIT